MIIRRAAFAGQFYAAGMSSLNKQIKDCFMSKFGPRNLPGKIQNKKIIGAISPHAGYMYSGPGAAWVYKELGESKQPDVYLIIAPNHTGYGAQFSTYIGDAWEIPYGSCKIDQEFGKSLIEKFSELKDDKIAHLYEHDIEVQLPFLYYINKNFKFLPIVVSDIDYGYCKIISEAIASLNKKICVITSSDFTHYGKNYGYEPFSDKIKENMYNLDKSAISYIEKLDTNGFLNYIYKTRATICGYSAIAITIETCKKLGAKKARLLNYYTSGDIVNNYSNAVGYASIVFE
jgi:AmmeMemoRadiSam system protein B